ncbi:ribosome maturation factor RimP [Leptospira borgpetersenii]|uniref:ribosome maturation factor RimP n=1 Tax=Leptospira borgpetersenii TaxID=174 RepID=UPI001F488568|nr:ribosome maturation factor RimP [Leptospira borgpetersenii]MCH1890152.1 ribosome maturation factor RimP [Leptospira borgpetersenii]MCH1896676.1 ribosome maturation factor RimP [Leptospira borgpetersenii]UPO16276.1 ribosome maturation factor RimP [Leptospira borgpetersenii]UYM86128.1 ribosome maturation factor RimP [Leptospira borgpetersenii]UZN12098.1 ribosome maturation factor RimP [Leptospira borgpetersenii]
MYSLKVNQRPNHSLIEVVLDNLEHPYGSVSLLECEQVSRKLKEELERISPDLDFTLKVSSAGAERKLHLPEDIDRFRGIPVRLVFRSGESEKNQEGIFRIVNRDGDQVFLEKFQKGKKSAVKKQTTLNLKDILKGNLYVSI